MQSQKLFEKAILDYREKYSQLEYQNLKIIFNLSSPVVNIMSLHFDGLLAGMVFQRILSEYNFYWHIGFNNKMYNIPIPIEKEKYIDNANNEDWFYKASLVQFAENPINKKTSYKKRFSENHLDLLNQKSVYIDRGWTKNYDVPIPYVANNFEISFYCCGNKKEIEKILQPPFAIGKHKEKGFGFVKSVEIKKMRKDYSIRNLTCLHRSIPEEYIEAKDLQNYTQNAIKGYFNYRPPYFKIRDTKLCYLPN